jgi:hypothetical protein
MDMSISHSNDRTQVQHTCIHSLILDTLLASYNLRSQQLWTKHNGKITTWEDSDEKHYQLQLHVP